MPALQRALPRLSLLTEGQIAQVHEYSLKILENTGVRLDSPELAARLAKTIGQTSLSGDRIRIPRQVVEWALKAAPSAIDIYDRKGKFSFRLGEDRCRFGIGVTSLFYQDPETDDVTPFTRKHMEQIVRLGSILDNFDVVSTIGIVQDVPPHISDLYATLEMVSNTYKPLVILVSDEDRFPDVLKLLEHLHGDLSSHPFVIPYFNPVTPLVLNKGTLDKIQTTIESGLPFIFSNYSMAGMSTPITPAGTLVLLMAELLAGLVISQIIKEGTPVILGILPAYFDLKTMVNFYGPQSMLLNLACAEMMAHYQLPHCGTSGSGTGWGPDLLASETYWMNHLTACLSKEGLAPFVGDTLGSKAFSPVNMVYVHEIITQALMFSQGFTLDDASAGLEEIDQAGPGGNFISSLSTKKHYRRAYYSSPIFKRWSMEKWQAQGRPAAIEVLRRYTRSLLQELKPAEDYNELMNQGETFIKKITK
jgi:trimethylamine--corrinoid protein Co-methyltransferase